MRAIAMGGACALLIGGLGIVGASCVGTVDPSGSEDAAGEANITPGREPVGEAEQELLTCECSTVSDYCRPGTHCRAGVVACRPDRSCGTWFKQVCNGWCLTD